MALELFPTPSWPRPAFSIPFAHEFKKFPNNQDMSQFPLTSQESHPELPEIVSNWACDTKQLYIAVEVPGKVEHFSEKGWRFGDGMLFTISQMTSEQPIGQYLSLGLAGTTKKPQIQAVTQNGHWFPKLDCSTIRFRLQQVGEINRYTISIPWSLLPPIRPLLYETIGINLTYVKRANSKRFFYQLTKDEHFDTELTDLRKILPVAVLDAQLNRPLAQSFMFNNCWQGENPIQVNLGLFNPSTCPARVDVTIKAQEKVLERHSSTVELAGGPHRWSLKWSPQRPLPTGEYILELTGEGCGKSYKKQHPFCIINPEELAELRRDLHALEEGYKCIFPGAIHTALASLEWLEEDLIKGWYEYPDISGFFAAKSMLEILRNGDNPLLDKPGLSRRAFRSKDDGSLQSYSLYLPKGFSSDKKWPMLVFLHGSGVDEKKIAGAQELHKLADKLGLVLLFPRSRTKTGFYLDQDEADLINNLIVVKKRFPIDWNKIFLGGFSMGGFGAWHTGLRNPNIFAGLAIISGVPSHPFLGREIKPGYSFSPADYAEIAKQLPILVVHGSADTSIPPETVQETVQALNEKGAKPLYNEIAGAGHGNFDWYSELLTWLKPLLK